MLSVVPTPLTVRAPAKVNLHLGVGDVRPDGFHELVTVFQALSLHDDVTLVPSDALSLHVTGEGARDVPTDPTNLAARAVVALAERYGRDPNMRIDIAKGIPVAGGMAGGSADAAAALLGAATLWGLEIGRDELDEVAATLGSDVPFSLHGHTALGTGRGERLIPALARGEFHWTLALAREGLSTPAVYRELDRLREAGDPPRAGSPDALLAAVASGDPHRLAPLLANDLQAAALSLQPGLRRTLRAGMEAGALAGIVSGSGPTCAFLCASADDAVDVGTELAGAGVCRTVRVASGPVPGATVVP
ncbi:4-(cytidine 5'-diphospho)-2-C-methyl-D-erythritol kinase [Tsukamurella tyrosinosolvens]|uniref:4-(cytidine 5'-diphospho)-2-C-methyl-D-erythritol kinase n=1 Tax=Tsukamurella tyrosinosolvens TaxID=57704 RepID=UPI000792DF2C|nr:4-(cytidine 5'-diphospho)-2-C-methyl-D-erythritol kinase [Tsukamurella tyrosinosolvens]KXO97234.1 4-diphosphocytidyl-2C-methyl-D-erythritol kinase [Tsukamurella tyrosinosolvens]KXP02759.1 4-diphosphocytidyl-2C-methyl-D-erythritol kinase [Tsukamurella tyrosinosolvens]MCA4997247.1 4-(cytidine 5'-diphospho)-2-C-methyl-D-erythritol kinase [Tsukamurella tyrosinosolvens]MEC4613430.1 4-(cytidine 5'-diphospho)-2-C-methyl-D-erythritol kinase [Tsukamurella tyrosinosolvens]QRY86272.1 4-(cytidine 5'-di